MRKTRSDSARQKNQRLQKEPNRSRSPELPRHAHTGLSFSRHARCLLVVLFAVSVTVDHTTTTVSPPTASVSHAAQLDTSPPTAHPEPAVRCHQFPASQIDFNAPNGVKGKLKPCLDFWKNVLSSSAYITDVIDSGYKIPFDTIPPTSYARNNKSSLIHPNFVESAIAELLRNNCVIQVNSQPYCCNALTVADGKKLRLVLDLRIPNQYIQISKFKYDDLKLIAQVLDRDQYYVKYDLKSGYHHIDIFPPHQKYLGFAWRHHDSITRYYTFTVLPFGLSSACYIFTKLCRPLVYHWRARGIQAFMYIDDGLIVSPSAESAAINMAIVRDTITRSGFIPNSTKCVWNPVSSIQFLGLIIDSPSTSFIVPQLKIDSLFSTINSIKSAVRATIRVPIKSLARFTGLIISMSLALGPVARLMTRATYSVIESRLFWSDSVFVPDSVISEFDFWLSNITSLNGFPFKYRLVPSMQIFSDASATGYGGYIQGRDIRVQGHWSDIDASKSSTWRELSAVHRILLELHNVLVHQKVKWFSDNSNVPRIIKCGSPKPDLQDISMSIFSICRQHDIILFPLWIPRAENTLADELSKIQDFDDWSLDDSSFSLIDALWGPHSVDRFASPHNAKLPVFNTRFWCRGSSGVDAFGQNWSVGNNYICPPASLIVQVFSRLKSFKAAGTLIIPKWTSAMFWPVICPDGSHLEEHIMDWRLLNVSFHPPTLGNSLFCHTPSFLTLAIRVDFSAPPRASNRGFCCADLGYCHFCAG